MKTKITFLILLLSCSIELNFSPVFAQTDSVNISQAIFFDRFGNIHHPNDLIIPSEEDIIRHSHKCTAGFFQSN